MSRHGGAGSRAEREAAAWLARLRGPDSAAHHDAFEAWYVADAENEAAYERLLATWTASAAAAETPAGQARPPLVPRGGGLRPWHGAIAAALALFVLTGIFLPRAHDIADAPDRVMLASALGEIRTVTLSDGTRATLDTQTRLQENFSQDERRVIIESGRARFEVAGDPRPFIVEADGRGVTGTGSFDLERLGGDLSIAALSGEIRVSDGGRSWSIVPGRMLQTSADGPARETALPRGASQWTAGILSFEDVPLGTVAAAINRYNATAIRIDPGAVRLRFTGTLHARQPEAAARTLAAAFRLDLSRDGRGDFFLAAPTK
ncbi:FecR family protein [Sphingomonas psychrotolerans]|uniref:DUF4880 domain-containing protein n=1 Tax=Sphingomonas psychrotolerans TaxID=1327635 RepID=A0A2K8MBA8_9SPHN|nr:FecR domain-containing protein [Sphingomonas psychrotolerans]ATY31172.1 hypothetical protein CVN68_03565 [Sphingomonas psychrotolerans]